MWIARPIRVDVGKAKYLSQSLDKARLVGLIGLCESAVYIKHHEFHRIVRMSLTRQRSATAGASEHELESACFHKGKRDLGAASGWLQRLVRRSERPHRRSI